MTDAKGLAGLEERRADLAGASLRYFVGGAGPPLVLVHGLAGAASNWVELVPLLACRHRLLVPDLPGHGGSGPLPSAPTLDPYADAVVELARREATAPAVFVGHSLGGAVVLRAAALHPGEVTAAVLLAGAGISSTGPSLGNSVTLALLGRPARAVQPLRALVAQESWARRLVFGYCRSPIRRRSRRPRPTAFSRDRGSTPTCGRRRTRSPRRMSASGSTACAAPACASGARATGSSRSPTASSSRVASAHRCG